MNENYELLEKKHIKSYNCDGYFLLHKKSGARVVKFAGNYPNKTFCIAFKTLPYDDSGVPHILEHSVLNGSKKYPVKSPFDELIKGSFYTFLNAMTAENFTMYPCASTNEKDYFNLMDVYLDAVFNPLIYSDKRILKQEGWRILLKDKNAVPEYTGVVYNEMKGAFSDPQTLMYYEMMKTLFPDNCYGKCAGGDPEKIPTLTQENFENFHKKYYRPENAFIYFFGDADLEKELDFLDKNYLSNFTKQNINYDIPLQKPFDKPKTRTAFYPSDGGGQSYISLDFVTCKNTDIEEFFGLYALGEILIEQESGIIRQAFTAAGLGDEISFAVEPSQQTVAMIVAYGCEKDSAQDFKELVTQCLIAVCENGIDSVLIDGVMNRLEFFYKEFADSQLGIKIIQSGLYLWFADADPMKIIEFDELRPIITSEFLTGLIKKYFLNNNHSLLLTLEPKSGLNAEINAKVQKELTDYVSGLSESQKEELVEENKKLEAFMNTPDSPEALKCIPHLTKDDLQKKAADYQVVVSDNIIRYETFTNGIFYTTLYFDLRVLPFEMLPYAGLLAEILDNMPTEKYGFAEFDNLQDLLTGSFSTSTGVYSKIVDFKRVSVPEFKVKTKFMTKKTKDVFALLDQMINHSVISDKERLKELVSRLNCQMKNSLDSDPFSALRDRAESYFVEDGYINEFLDGFDFYFFVRNLDENFDERADNVISKLTEVADKIFRRDNIKVSVTCEKEYFADFETVCREFFATLNPEKSVLYNWDIKPEAKNEAFIGNSKVQYVFKCADMLKNGFKFNGCNLVLKKILSSDYLQNNVRVKGGAYGSWFGFSDSGYVSFSSYRDPNLEKTLEVYSKAAEYLENFSASDDEMLKYIIGTLSNEDRPMTAKQEGATAVSRYFKGEKFEDVQRERDEILSCTAQNVRDFATIIKEAELKSAICVYGSEEKIRQNESLFKKVIKL
jgi:hypothetical protein